MTEAQPGQAGPLIYGVPLALWITAGVAVLAALVSVAVSVLSNRSTRKNVRLQLDQSDKQAERRMLLDADLLKIQLDHDATQKDRERHMALRREIYIDAAAAMVSLQGLLGRVQNIDEESAVILTDFQRAAAILAKIQIVGSDDTVAAVMEFMNRLGPAFLQGVALRMPLAVRKAEIDTHDDLMRRAGVERERFTGMLQQLNLTGGADPRQIAAINVQYEFATKQFNEHLKKANELRQQQTKEQRALADQTMIRVLEATRLFPSAVLAVRRELEIMIDEGKYRELWDQQLQQVERAHNEAMAHLDVFMRQRDTKSAPQPGPGEPT